MISFPDPTQDLSLGTKPARVMLVALYIHTSHTTCDLAFADRSTSSHGPFRGLKKMPL